MDRTVNELASHFGVHPTLIHRWKKQLLAGAEEVFADGSKTAAVAAEVVPAQLYEQIGRLQRELAWVKKKLPPRLTLCGRWSSPIMSYFFSFFFSTTLICFGSSTLISGCSRNRVTVPVTRMVLPLK